MYQQQYWKGLIELKVRVAYLNAYAADSEKWDKRIGMFIALSSSTSVGAWIIWKSLDFLWACIIATSQVTTTVLPFLPFKQRLKGIAELNGLLSDLSLECERGWFEVSQGQLSEKEIHDRTMTFKDKALKAEKQSLGGLILPDKAHLFKLAENRVDTYLRHNYPGG